MNKYLQFVLSWTEPPPNLANQANPEVTEGTCPEFPWETTAQRTVEKEHKIPQDRCTHPTTSPSSLKPKVDTHNGSYFKGKAPRWSQAQPCQTGTPHPPVATSGIRPVSRLAIAVTPKWPYRFGNHGTVRKMHVMEDKEHRSRQHKIPTALSNRGDFRTGLLPMEAKCIQSCKFQANPSARFLMRSSVRAWNLDQMTPWASPSLLWYRFLAY